MVQCIAKKILIHFKVKKQFLTIYCNLKGMTFLIEFMNNPGLYRGILPQHHPTDSLSMFQSHV